jgi:hypothetical protein
VGILLEALRDGKPLYVAAARADMDRKTARKWAKCSLKPSESKIEHDWRTREDVFSDVWDDLAKMLKVNPGLQAKSLFEYLQREHPGRFADPQLRTLQRRVRHWRATEGPDREIFFPQEHRAGELCASDFTHMKSLGIRIAHQPFDHLLYHFVLTYSNWETASICFSESLEALSEGLQRALFEIGGVPVAHRTDRLSAAVMNWSRDVITSRNDRGLASADFTVNYERLLHHYGLRPQRTQAGHGNENGDAEQRHHRLKVALDQALLLRGSREFGDREEYEQFLRALIAQLNSGRMARFAEEQRCLAPLPSTRLDSLRTLTVRVGPSSTVYVLCNVYSVSSRLIGEHVDARIGAEAIDIYYGKTHVETLPRLRGRGHHRIQYQHIINWLVRKPGAFANYRYRTDLFPSSRFRMAYDALSERSPERADRGYLAVLLAAADRGEAAVEAAIEALLAKGSEADGPSVLAWLDAGVSATPITHVQIAEIDLSSYDQLIERAEERQ